MSGSGLLEDPDIGELKFLMKRWDLDFVATFELKELKSRQCTAEDFEIPEGQRASKYGLYPIDKESNSLQGNLHE